MATIVTRGGKGSALTHTELDDNFSNLNNDKVEASGDTITGHLTFEDDVKARFGDNNDLEIYHDGSNSIIRETAAGSLLLRGTNLHLQAADNAMFVQCLDEGAVTIYHNASPKLATTATGVSVTGNIAVTGTVDGRDVAADGAKAVTAHGWGNHADAGYLTSFSETSHADVVVDGDFTSQGLMKRGSSAGSYSIVTDNSTNWNTAYGWGDHSTAGYLTSYTETDTLANVTGRGATTTDGITIDSGTSLGLKIDHDSFGNALELHREDASNVASIKFSNNSGETGILYARDSDKTQYGDRAAPQIIFRFLLTTTTPMLTSGQHLERLP